MTNEDFQAIIDRYLEGSATPEEEKLLNVYYDDRIQTDRVLPPGQKKTKNWRRVD